MNEEKKSKEGSLQLHMFKSWGKEELIDFEAHGNVVAVWCKLCNKHIEKIKADNTLQGKEKEDALNYTKKLTFVKKGNINRHLCQCRSQNYVI